MPSDPNNPPNPLSPEQIKDAHRLRLDRAIGHDALELMRRQHQLRIDINLDANTQWDIARNNMLSRWLSETDDADEFQKAFEDIQKNVRHQHNSIDYILGNGATDQEKTAYESLNDGGPLASAINSAQLEHQNARTNYDNTAHSIHAVHGNLASVTPLIDQINDLNGVHDKFNDRNVKQREYNAANDNLSNLVGTQLFTDKNAANDKQIIDAAPWPNDPANPGNPRSLTEEEIVSAKSIFDKINGLRGDYQNIISSPEYNSPDPEVSEPKKQEAKTKLSEVEKQAVNFYKKFGGYPNLSEIDQKIRDYRPPAEKLDPYVPLLKKELEKIPTDDYNWLKRNINRNRPADAVPTASEADQNARKAEQDRYDEMTTKYTDLIKKIKLHMASDPAHEHNVFDDADDDINRRKDPGEWEKFVRRIGRMANVAGKYTFEKSGSIDKYGRHYDQIPEYAYGEYNLIKAVGVLAWNSVAGISGLAWNTTLGKIPGFKKNSQSGFGKVASEQTITERHQEENDTISAHREFIHTGGNFSGVGSGENLNPDKLKNDNWIVRFLTGKQKDWYSTEDSYLGKKANKHALTKPAEYDHEVPDDETGRKYKAHQINESFKKDKKHNPNFQAMLKALSEIDPDDLRPIDEQQLDFKRKVQTDSETFRQSGDTKHLEEQVEKHLAKLRRQLDTTSGAIWDRYLAGDHNAPIAAGMDILQTMVDEKKRLNETKKKAAEAEKAWREASDQTDAMFDENEFVVDGKRRYFTTRTIKGSELPGGRRELVLKDFDKKFNMGKIDRWDAIGAAMQRKSGEWSAVDASSIAMKQHYRFERDRQKAIDAFNNTDFVEYTAHIYNADGTVRRDDHDNDITAQGQVVGYVDSRSGGLIGTNGNIGEPVISISDTYSESSEFEFAALLFGEESTDALLNIEVKDEAKSDQSPESQVEIESE